MGACRRSAIFADSRRAVFGPITPVGARWDGDGRWNTVRLLFDGNPLEKPFAGGKARRLQAPTESERAVLSVDPIIRAMRSSRSYAKMRSNRCSSSFLRILRNPPSLQLQMAGISPFSPLAASVAYRPIQMEPPRRGPKPSRPPVPARRWRHGKPCPFFRLGVNASGRSVEVAIANGDLGRGAS